MDLWTILLQIFVVGIFIYYYFNRKFSYWNERGVKGPSPSIPFGNVLSFFRDGQVKIEKDWLQKYGKLYGNYQMTAPILTVIEPELIKQVLVKDFHIFVNRDKLLFDHEIFNHNLFNSEDEQWRRIRSITSPTFTSGKLRGMQMLMDRCVDKLANYFDRIIDSPKNGCLNAKEVVTGFTIDVIASTSFATETNANGDLSSDNIFVEHGTELMDFKAWRILAFFALPIKVNRWLDNSLGFSDWRFNFFVNLSRTIIHQRKNGKNKRNDLIQLLMDSFVYENQLKGNNYESLTASADHDMKEAENVPVENTNPSSNNTSDKRTLTENEIIAQCIIFFIAGFETTATTISNVFYYLAINPDIQDRLCEELQILNEMDVNSREYFDKVNSELPYLDAIIKETLRLNPPLTRLQRRVGIHGYKLGGIPLDKDIEINIPTYALHHCEDFYPEPDRFNPERFMPENKHLLIPYTYLPFGGGPRNCVGMRFAYQEIKLCLAKIVRSYQFDKTSETKIPLEYSKIALLTCKNIPLKVSRR
ncbi:hypothetical protein RDWZM_001567 [Blomia tropicalis]|uniref:Cytochrome P450 n=1 Tax=Blomia tropicalis TaxID=40697 RepID=A0A9Q0MEN5_BLOTA|nr:hypothetical protein RDWZM_001567 [Blomia tropicalis]